MFGPKTKVLVVDDMMTMRKLVMRSLKELGLLEFTEAEDGAKAWQLLSSDGGFDLVISDWNMPNCTGLDLLRRVRSDSRYTKLPFVLVTAEADKAQVVEALTAGVSAYVVKPFDTATIKLRLEEVYKKVA
jgi:two-component system chemotaxis response regulator CheY